MAWPVRACQPRVHAAVTAALLLVLCAAGPACRRAPVDATAEPTAEGSPGVSDPSSRAGSRRSPSPAEVSGDRSLEVIRTRIAWKEGGEATGSPPTATVPPHIVLEVRQATVSAPAIGLLWLRSAGGLFEYADAVSHCSGLDTGGYADWRLPEIVELERLVAVERGAPWLSGVQELWSATPHRSRGVETVTLPAGVRSHQAVGMAHVVCVRDLAR